MKRDRLHNKQLLSEVSEDKDLLLFLSKNKRSNIRKGVAKNPNTPILIIQNLMNDDNIGVVKQVCQRDDLSYEMFKSLFDRKIHEITVQLTKNENLPEDIQIEILSNDANYISYHFDIAQRTRNREAINIIIGGAYPHHNGAVMHRLLKNPNLTKEDVRDIYNKAVNGNIFYRSELLIYGIANHKYVEKDMLIFLSKKFPIGKQYFLTLAGYGNFF